MHRYRTIILSSLLAGCAVLAGCGEDIRVEEEEHNTMSFSPLPETLVPGVKSLLEKAADLQSSEGLGLFGTLSYGTGTPTIFNNDWLRYAAPAWTYGYSLYWIKGGVYNFAAIYPYTTDKSQEVVGSGNATYSFNTSAKLTMPVQTTWQTKDLMYGFADRDLTTVENYSKVDINMQHAFAALDFRIVNASGEEVKSVSDAALKNIITKATFECASDSPAAVWSNTSVSDGDEYTRSGQILKSVPYSSTEHSLFENYFVVIPQEVYGKGATISFSKEGGNNQKDVVLNLGTVPDVKSWEAGKKYTYIITLQSTAITFTVSVVDWIENKYNLN